MRPETVVVYEVKFLHVKSYSCGMQETRLAAYGSHQYEEMNGYSETKTMFLYSLLTSPGHLSRSSGAYLPPAGNSETKTTVFY